MSKETFTSEEAKAVSKELGIDWDSSPFDLEQFRQGIDVELEHGTRDLETNVTDDDPLTTGKITLAHLRELPDYYTPNDQWSRLCRSKRPNATRPRSPIRTSRARSPKPAPCGG